MPMPCTQQTHLQLQLLASPPTLRNIESWRWKKDCVLGTILQEDPKQACGNHSAALHDAAEMIFQVRSYRVRVRALRPTTSQSLRLCVRCQTALYVHEEDFSNFLQTVGFSQRQRVLSGRILLGDAGSWREPTLLVTCLSVIPCPRQQKIDGLCTNTVYHK